MNLKKKIKAFFSFKRRSDGGFTLVELIVVIAILAILAGVGTAGYSGYIKNANKNADKVLVGNIMRAIETGTNSTMFVNDDSFKLGKLSYPVGFVTLSTNGTSVVTSQTEVYPATEGVCNFVEATIAVPVASSVQVKCNKNHNKSRDIYSVQNVTVRYCSSHTKDEFEPYVLSADLATDFATGWSGTGCSALTTWDCNPTWTPTATLTIPQNSLYSSNQSKLYTEHTASGMCEAAYANQYDTFGESVVGVAAAGDPLLDSITAAFGSDLSALQLSYDEWTSEEGSSYASFFTGAPQLMEDMEQLSGMLSTASKWSGVASMIGFNLGISQTYDTDQDVLTGVSQTISTSHTLETWSAQWNNNSTMTWDSYGFNLEGRENYSAVRTCYNSAFASYMEANGESEFADVVRYFNTQEVTLFGTTVGLPGLVCTDAFVDPDCPLKSKFTQAGATEEDFARIAGLYEEYVSSGACKANGDVIYDTMNTFGETSDAAIAYTKMNGGTLFDYYNKYVDEMAELYSQAQTAAGDGIVIVVVVEDGKLNFQVSPAAADPRND